MKRLIPTLFRFILPIALLLAQHGVWAHGFGHDLAKMAAHGQSQEHGTHACCLPFEASGDAACGTPRFEVPAIAAASTQIEYSLPISRPAPPAYLSRAPPPHS